MDRTDMDAKDAEGAGRSAYYEDPAKPVWVGLPFMVAAAAALLILGHFYNRRPGRRGGVDPAKPAACGSSNKSKQIDDRLQNLGLEELRRRRAEAAEARLQRGATNDGPGVATPTPLGRILMLCRKVDALEADAKRFFDSLNSESLLQDELQEKRRLIDGINHLQLEIDSVQVDESVGPHRKVQSARLQHLLAVKLLDTFLLSFWIYTSIIRPYAFTVRILLSFHEDNTINGGHNLSHLCCCCCVKATAVFKALFWHQFVVERTISWRISWSDKKVSDTKVYQEEFCDWIRCPGSS